ncbi:PadR family transcriptional regulator (plasmid) [Rossellomorea sp. FS2]|uniref:PadR family transcriptional regulator n=1 Tax=Rossellomorea sp. FS2 TaxID=3391447 RepID=UPI003A4D642A
MLKGILEGCILAIINDSPTYAYELTVKLHQKGLTHTSEGSIYPLILRLQKEGLVISENRKSTVGPDRKYLSLTAEGVEALNDFSIEWSALSNAVKVIVRE